MAGASSPLPTGTVTFLFTDIEGSTRLLSTLGDEYRDALERHASIVRRAISSHEGREVATEGDSFFAVFPSAEQAVQAAAEIQRELAATRWPRDEALRLRMGLHTGEGRLGGDSYVGLDVHRAARIAAAGHGGQVLVSDATRAVAARSGGEGVAMRDLGDHRFKDFDVPMRIWQLELEGLPSDFPPIRSLGAPSDTLPVYLTTFLGRDHEMMDVLDLIAAHRLVTLTGAGGTGKTRLAAEAARAVAIDRGTAVYFTDLSPIRQPELVAIEIARALRLPIDPAGDAAGAVRAHVADRRLLLVLDNFEQVVDAAPFVRDLLQAAPQLRMLVTSRMPLGVEGEHEYAVAPLPTSVRTDPTSAQPAVDLFVDRARAVRSDFALTDESSTAVHDIIAHVGGLPLAIELAATQVRFMSPTAILARLEQHRPLATSGERRVERQRTMAAAVDWSYQLLAISERRVFARLSAFAGPASLEAVEHVCDGGETDEPVLDAVAGLLTKSLVRREDDAGDSEPRYAMLEPIREYALERLRREFDGDATRRRHAEFFAAFAHTVEPHLTRMDQLTWLDRCELERANLRQAIEWAIESGSADLGLGMAAALWRFWQLRGPIWEGRALLDRLLALPGASPSARARGLGAAGGLAWWGEDLAETRRCYEEALPLARASADERLQMDALFNLAFVRAASGPDGVDSAIAMLDESIAIAERLGDRLGAVRGRHGKGFVAALFTADYPEALRIFRESARAYEEMGEGRDLGDAIVSMGNVQRRLGQFDEARASYLRGLDMAIAAGNRPVAIGLLVLVAALESDAGNHGRALRLWAAGEALRGAAGGIRPAVAHRLLGDPVAAARAALSRVEVDAALDEGRRFDYEAAIAYAHAGSGVDG